MRSRERALAKAERSKAKNRDAKIIAASGLDAEATEKKSSIAGASAFLKKPYSADRLLGQLHTLLL